MPLHRVSKPLNRRPKRGDHRFQLRQISQIPEPKLAFLGTSSLLGVGTTLPLATEITGFFTGDTISLNGVTANTSNYANGTLSLYNGTTLVDQLDFSGPYTTANFALSSTSGTANTLIEFAATTSRSSHASLTPLSGASIEDARHLGIFVNHPSAV